VSEHDGERCANTLPVTYFVASPMPVLPPLGRPLHHTAGPMELRIADGLQARLHHAAGARSARGPSTSVRA